MSIGTLFSGITLALLLAFAKRVDRKANLFLSFAIIVMILKVGGLTQFLLPAFGPIIFFYVRNLTLPERLFSRRDLLHFCPLLLGFWIPGWLVLIIVIFYLYLSHHLIQQCYRRLRLVLMDRPRFAFRRLEKTLFLLGVFCAISLFNESFYLIIAFVLMGMAVETMLKPDVAVQLSTSTNDRTDAREKGRRLKEAVATNRLYEDPELTLATLALKLRIAPHDLSRIINTGLKKNFNDFINEFRVREIVWKMEDPDYDRITLIGIAYESGFNSKTTFNRVFKEMTGKTPAEYKNSLKKEVPNDNLVLRSRIRPVTLRLKSPSNWVTVTSKRNAMFRNYLKIAYRQLQKQKSYAAVKVGGLALGIAACLLIALFIRDEMGHDRMYPGADRIYRLLGDGQFNTGWDWPAPLSRAIQSDFPEVEYAGRVQPKLDIVLRRADQTQNYNERGYLYVDQPFFDALQLPIISGNSKTALTEPQTMVITQSLADKYYRGENAVGKVMYLDNDKAHPYRISAVMADIPGSSHLNPFSFFLTLSGKEFWQGEQNNWSSYNYIVYVKLKTGTDVAAFEKKLSAHILQHYFFAGIS